MSDVVRPPLEPLPLPRLPAGRYVEGSGPQPCRLAIFGEGPGKTEERRGIPFCGRAGEVLDELLWRAGYRRQDVYVSNVRKIRCVDKHGKDRPPTDAEIAEHADDVALELLLCKAELVVTLGGTAARALLLPEYRDLSMDVLNGMTWPALPIAGGRILPVIHPAAGLYSPAQMGKVGWGLRQIGAALEQSGVVRPRPRPMNLKVNSEARLLPGTWVAADTEGTVADPICWSLASETGETHVDPSLVSGLDATRLVLHNALFDAPILERLGHVVDWGQIEDTMVMAYLLQQEPRGLKGLCVRHFLHRMRTYNDVVEPYTERARWTLVETLAQHAQFAGDKKHWAWRAWKDKSKGKTVDLKARAKNAGVELPTCNLRDVSSEERAHYSGEDAWATAQLYPILWRKVREMGLERAYRVDMGALPMVDRMQRVGMLVDIGELKALQTDLEAAELVLRAELRGIAGRETFNPAAPQQVRELLFDELRLPLGRKTKTGLDSTDEKAMARLKGKHRAVDAVLDWREVSKMLSTFVLPLWGLMDSEGRVHPQFSGTHDADTDDDDIASTGTGRYAIANPNLLAFPAHSAWGKRVRKCFRAGKGRALMSFDLSQIELRVGAHESQDPTMLQVYRDDGDIHDSTQKGFGVSVRMVAKRVNFGTFYGLQAPGLQTQLAMDGLAYTLPECQEFIDRWFATYPGVKTYLKAKHSECRKHGFVRSPAGRIRYLPLIWSDDGFLRGEAERQAGNFPIQCLPASTRIRTSNGFERIGDFKAGAVWTGAEWAFAKLIPRGSGEIVEVVLDDGALFRCDTAHRLLVYKGAWPEWSLVTDLRVGDLVADSIVSQPFDTGSQAEPVEFWYWIGRYYGDGHYTVKTGYKNCRRALRWAFGDAQKEEAVRCLRFFEGYGLSPSMSRDVKKKANSGGRSHRPVHVVNLHGKRLVEKLQEHGIAPNEYAGTKRIADRIFRLDAARRQAVVDGYYDADGTRAKKYSNGAAPVHLTSINLPLLRDTQLLLRSLNRSSKILGPYRGSDPHHRPFYRLRFSDQRQWRRVVSVTSTGTREKVYTLTVDHPKHAYDSEGLISKNSGAAEQMKLGMARAWRDWGILEIVAKAQPLLQIHDDLLLECDDTPIARRVVREHVTEALESAGLSIPVKCAGKVGGSWGELKE